MEVKQLASLVNEALKETTGVEAVVAEDLSDLVDAGDAVLNAGAYDNYGRSISNVIGRNIFVSRPYEGRVPSMRKDAWTYGSIARKIRVVPKDAEENETWNLTPGASYDPNIFSPAETHEKFFNKRTTFQIPISLTEIQIKESFQNAEQLNAFVEMIERMILNSLTKATENLALRTLNNFTAETIYSDYAGAALSSKSGIKAVNLLYNYNQEANTSGTTLTAAKALFDPAFIRYASLQMRQYASKLRSWSKLFNIGATDKFTPESRLRTYLLDVFESAAAVYLYNGVGQFRDDELVLPKAETVAYWQGSGTDFAFSSISKINVTTTEGHSVEASGILGIMMDEEAAMICNDQKRVTTGYNPVGEFYNYWHKQDCQYLNDFDEQYVVFFIA